MAHVIVMLFYVHCYYFNYLIFFGILVVTKRYQNIILMFSSTIAMNKIKIEINGNYQKIKIIIMT
jgi:hypothetical protein